MISLQTLKLNTVSSFPQFGIMVIGGEKSYKHIDEGPIRSRRTRSPTTTTGENGSDDDDVGMRVGSEYQATVPEFVSSGKLETKSDSMLVWAAHHDADVDKRIDAYAAVAKEKHGYNMEQALGMLFWHKHNFEKALADLPNFTPFPDEWTVEDKVLFEQAFNFHGKSFQRIRQMLPDKSIASLVKYYYSWKKTRSRTSLIDRQAHKVSSSRNVSDEDDSESSAGEEPKDNSKEEIPPRSSVLRGGLISPRKVDMHARLRNRRKPPRGMYLSAESLSSFATSPAAQADALLKKFDAELIELKRQVQNNKQHLSLCKDKTTVGIGAFRIQESGLKLNGKWTNDELLLAVQGVRRYGKNYRAIAEVIGNKNESLVRSFFVTYRRRFKLDEVLAEYEKEHGVEGKPQREETPMEEESVSVGNNGSAAAPASDSAATSASDVKLPATSAVTVSSPAIVATVST